MKRQWHTRRVLLPAADGQQRWDRAYQSILTWTAAGRVPTMPPMDGHQLRGVEHDRGDLRAGLDATASASADD